MGVTNFDNLAQNIVQMRLQDARQTINEQKGSLQVTTGANMIYYLISATATLRKITSVSQPITVFATLHATDVVTPLADMVAKVATSSDGTSYAPVPDFPDSGAPTFYVYDQHGADLVDKQATFGVVISNVPIDYYIKVDVQFLANGSGTA